MSGPTEDQIMALASVANPRSRQHDERTADRRSMWRCVPIQDIVGIRAVALAARPTTLPQALREVFGDRIPGATDEDWQSLADDVTGRMSGT